MPGGKWPFPGDSPIARARKVALAYRALAEEQVELIAKLKYALRALDNLPVENVDPELPAKIEELLAFNADDPVHALDQRFTQWGEQWHSNTPIHYEPDDWVVTKIAANLINISTGALSRLRKTGRIKGRFVREVGIGGYTYQVKDVYALSEQLRGRAWRTDPSTDTVTDSRSSAPNDRK